MKELPEKTYVVFPEAEAIDVIIIDGSRAMTLQITTEKKGSRLKSKFKQLNEYCTELQTKAQGKDEDLVIIPWFISLEGFSTVSIQEEYSGLISIGDLWSTLSK